MKNRNSKPFRIDDDWLGCIVGLLIVFLVGVLPGLLN